MIEPGGGRGTIVGSFAFVSPEHLFNQSRGRSARIEIFSNIVQLIASLQSAVESFRTIMWLRL